MKRIISMLCIAFIALGIFTVTAISAESTSDSNLFLGDASLDGKVNVKDATSIQKYVAGLVLLSEEGLLAADADLNKTINVKDATLIQKFTAGYKFDYPIGDPIAPEESAPEETTPDETTPGETTKPSEPESTAPTTPDNYDFAPVDTDLSDPVTKEVLWKIEEGFLRLVNEEREKFGLAPLTHNKHLDDVAQIRSSEIILFYSHTRPNGKPFHSPLDRNKYPYINVGENIDMSSHMVGFFNPATDKFIGSEKQIEDSYTILFEGFKNSPGHYANMMDENYKHTGIGISYVYDAQWGVPYFYISHIFGSDS